MKYAEFMENIAVGAEYYASSRRKRFTRRQRRNLTDGICGERTSRSTSALNKVHKIEYTTSSSDSDNIREQRKRSNQLATTRKRGQSTTARGVTSPAEAAFLSLRQNYVYSSLLTRSTTEICCKSTSTRVSTSNEPVDTFHKFKGPAARKAHRRTLRYKLNLFANNQLETKAGSQAGLDIHTNNTQPEKDTRIRRSMSVRELNGTMIDFTNQDSVTRWTSQILAEIDSLPSSSFDLTGQPTSQSSPFISTGTSAAITDIISSITDTNISSPNNPECDPLERNIQSPLENDSNISFEMGVMNSTLSAQSHDNKSQSGYWTQKIASKSSPSRFAKFQKRNSLKKHRETKEARKINALENDITKIGDFESYFPMSPIIGADIWHQSADIPETSCTAQIVLTARPSNRRKQSAHAVVISAPKNPKRSEEVHFLSPRFGSNNDRANLQNHINPKNKSSNNESSRLWRFLSRKKYSSFKKYLKLHQKNAPTIEIISDTEVSGFGTGDLPVFTSVENHFSECNSEPKWKNSEIESNDGLPVPRTSLPLTMDMKPYQRFSRMPNSVHGQLSGYTTSNDMQWRRNIDGANAKNSSDVRVGNRTCFSMESIDLAKESATYDRLKFLGETKKIQLVDETPSSLTVWKRRVSCVCVSSLLLTYDELSSSIVGV
uniref:Non-specific serine/threonine protein kinase n=1 Tax=Loa loa TaxID=7209 RepID=A0A1I7VM69_LOALO